MKTTLRLLGWRRVLAIRLPEGLKQQNRSNLSGKSLKPTLMDPDASTGWTLSNQA